MENGRAPVFRELARAESEAILARNQVGRIAFGFHDRVDIEPIHYVYDTGWIYGRTAPGTKVTTLAHHPWVAFEVDQVDGLFDWRSVVVHGAVYSLAREDAAEDDHLRAVTLLRRLLPTALTGADPAPFRRVLFRVHASEIMGRAASTSHTGDLAAHSSIAASASYANHDPERDR
jgi:nitroimidazol reductase NimA-like FMN-containing flavoprotein (pyridoxamine 5'-phosphate oxidase superfamily)